MSNNMVSTSSNISDFRNSFNGGTRPNRFRVTASIPGQNVTSHFLIKAASIPPSTLGIISVPYRGRVLKIPGDRLFAEWSFTVLDDAHEGEDIRQMMVAWSNSINSHVANLTKDPNVSDSTAKWTVEMLNISDNGTVRVIELHNCWPVEVGAIELSYETADVITDFPCTLAYDYWTEPLTTDEPAGA